MNQVRRKERLSKQSNAKESLRKEGKKDRVKAERGRGGIEGMKRCSGRKC